MVCGMLPARWYYPLCSAIFIRNDENAEGETRRNIGLAFSYFIKNIPLLQNISVIFTD